MARVQAGLTQKAIIETDLPIAFLPRPNVCSAKLRPAISSPACNTKHSDMDKVITKLITVADSYMRLQYATHGGLVRLKPFFHYTLVYLGGLSSTSYDNY